MTSLPPHDPIGDLNQVLSEVINEVSGVKQARRVVPETHALHAELDQLFEDLRKWAELLIERDEALGVSPLSVMPSVAGRTPANLWPRGADDDEVRRVIGAHLDRLQEHVAAALAEQESDESRAPLAQMKSALLAHRRVLSGAVDPA
jgi:DNA-binding ferritin-like protein